MTTLEKVAYLKGLAEGYEIDKTTKDGKLLSAILEVLDDLAIDLEDLSDCVAEMGAQVDEIDEDLDALESDYYDDDDCCCGDHCDCDEDEAYEITCPNCQTEFEVDEETLLDGSVECPSCGETLEFDIDDCDCDCDDDCCCGDHCDCDED